MGRIISCMLSFIIPLLMFGQTLKKYQIETSLKDYTITTIDSFTRISTNKKNVSFLLDEQQPELPYTTLKILLPQNTKVTNVKLTNKGKQLVGTFKLPSNTPLSVESKQMQQIASIKYNANTKFPLNSIANYTQSSIDGYEVLYVSVCPFEYKANTGELFIFTNMELNYEISNKSVVVPHQIGHNMRKLVRSIVDNSDMLENLYPYQNSFTYSNYLIITADSLKSAFEPLADAKRYKGMTVFVVSVEDILSRYSSYAYRNYDVAEKIKCFIQDEYYNHNIGYVLLGGNCDIIPTRYCYGFVDNEVASIPTDWYYACVSNDDSYDLRWDYNENQIYGELSDRMDLSADLFVSRLPVNNRIEIDTYLHKRIKYENDQMYQDNSYNRMLFAGRWISIQYPYSDAQYWGTQIGTTIQGLYDANISYLYDTDSNLGNIYFSATNLQEQLRHTNAFVHIDTHGEPSKWLTDIITGDFNNPDRYYTSDSVRCLTSSGNTVITTSSCYSNDFDSNTSLGRTFLLHPNNGTLFFTGNSYKGIVPASFAMMYEPLIYCNMYQSLFSGQINNLEECLYLEKNNFYEVDDNIRNWTLYTINTIGDPDFCPYLHKPETLIVDAILSSGYLDITTNLANCTLNEYVEEDDNAICSTDFDYNCCVLESYVDKINFGIYKPGWVPYISNKSYCQNLRIQDFYEASFTAKGNKIWIGSDVIEVNQNNEFYNGDVVVNTGESLNIEVGQELTITKDFYVEIGGTLSFMPKPSLNTLP